MLVHAATQPLQQGCKVTRKRSALSFRDGFVWESSTNNLIPEDYMLSFLRVTIFVFVILQFSKGVNKVRVHLTDGLAV